MLSTCSAYFENMFEKTKCKHPVIVLKDIKYSDFEALLNYMYVGEVNVVQEKLSGLINAAECLQIKGLAVPDEEPLEVSHETAAGNSKRPQRSDGVSPRAKRRRRDDSTDGSGQEEQSPHSKTTASDNNQHNNKANSEDNTQVPYTTRRLRNIRSTKTISHSINEIEPEEVSTINIFLLDIYNLDTYSYTYVSYR